MSRLRILPRSLRWRLQLWLAFLLVAMLAGFGVTLYQLQRVNRFGQIDGELETRISALAGAVRELYLEQGPPPGDFGFGGPPPDWRPPPGIAVPRALFSNYYYVVWYRDGSVLTRSAAAPEDVTQPELSERDTLPHFRTRGCCFWEAVHCSGLGDCVLAGRSV